MLFIGLECYIPIVIKFSPASSDHGKVQLHTYKTLEVLAVYISSAQRNVLVAVMYRPGSQDASTEFLREFSDILERIATFSCPVIILGDLNLYLDEASSQHTITFDTTLEHYGLVQHVHSPTLSRGHTLDVVITRDQCPVRSVLV